MLGETMFARPDASLDDAERADELHAGPRLEAAEPDGDEDQARQIHKGQQEDEDEAPERPSGLSARRGRAHPAASVAPKGPRA